MKSRTQFLKILTTTAICLATVGLNSCTAQATPDNVVIEQAEKQVRLHWQNNPKLSYHSLSYKGTLQECLESWHYVQKVRTLQGTWISVHELPESTLVFEGRVKGFKPGKTKGGGGYFFCTPETGELIAYLLMK